MNAKEPVELILHIESDSSFFGEHPGYQGQGIPEIDELLRKRSLYGPFHEFVQSMIEQKRILDVEYTTLSPQLALSRYVFATQEDMDQFYETQTLLDVATLLRESHLNFSRAIHPLNS